jgi:unsaturated chondroitin disaccharide hydrolase
MIPLNEMKNFIIEKTKQNIVIFGDRLPSATDSGKYKFVEDGGWVGGFWNGINNLCYEMTGEQEFLEASHKSWHRYIKRLYDRPKTLDHDTGFLFILSFVADYKITGNAESRKVALDAAKVLKARFNEKGQFLQCWNVWKPGESFSEENRGRVIIDSMYNIPLLFWAFKETGDEDYKRVAVAHAQTCRKYIIREDFTSYHTYVFDHETGKSRYGRTFQGYGDESCWARGESWAIGGFAYAYRYTGIKEFLETSKACADVFIDNLEADNVALWDFRLKVKEGEPRDTSASCIAAASMLELYEHLEEDEKEKYKTAALNILKSVFYNYSTKDRPEDEGYLLHACGHKPANADTDCSLIYGDYYFSEAVARLLGKTVGYW